MRWGDPSSYINYWEELFNGTGYSYRHRDQIEDAEFEEIRENDARNEVKEN